MLITIFCFVRDTIFSMKIWGIWLYTSPLWGEAEQRVIWQLRILCQRKVLRILVLPVLTGLRLAFNISFLLRWFESYLMQHQIGTVLSLAWCKLGDDHASNKSYNDFWKIITVSTLEIKPNCENWESVNGYSRMDGCKQIENKQTQKSSFSQ